MVRGQILWRDLVVVKLDQALRHEHATLKEVVGDEAVDDADGLADDPGRPRDADGEVGLGRGGDRHVRGAGGLLHDWKESWLMMLENGCSIMIAHVFYFK